MIMSQLAKIPANSKYCKISEGIPFYKQTYPSFEYYGLFVFVESGGTKLGVPRMSKFQ